MTADPARWNHNIHYHPLLLHALADGCGRVLDVGCGEGMLARELGALAQHVVGIDRDEPSIELARRTTDAPNVEYVLGDALTYPFDDDSFDAIVSVATLHHLGARAGLERFRSLLRPGGTLGVVGLARSRYPRDLPVDLAGAVATRAHKRSKVYWEHSAPVVWPPPETYAEVRRIAADVVPGCTYRRHILWRYSIVWTKPVT